jgi:hypothetical protein
MSAWWPPERRRTLHAPLKPNRPLLRARSAPSPRPSRSTWRCTAAVMPAKERGDRRTRELGCLEMQLAPAAHRLLQRVRAECVQALEVGGELREKRFERGPTGGNVEALGGDEARVVVRGRVAGITEQAPRRALERREVLVVRAASRRGRRRAPRPRARGRRRGTPRTRSLPRRFRAREPRLSARAPARARRVPPRARGCAAWRRSSTSSGACLSPSTVASSAAAESPANSRTIERAWCSPATWGAARSAASRRASAASASPLRIHSNCARSRCASA